MGQAASGLGNMSCEGYAFVQGAREFLLEGNWCQGPPLWNENEVIFLGERATGWGLFTIYPDFGKGLPKPEVGGGVHI